MKTEYIIEPRNDHLRAIITGKLEFDVGKEIFLKALEATVKHGLNKILVDLQSLQGELTFYERFEFSEFMAQQNREYILTKNIINKQLRIAFVGGSPIIDNRKFGETVAINRGLEFLSTTDINEAFEWLGLEPDI